MALLDASQELWSCPPFSLGCGGWRISNTECNDRYCWNNVVLFFIIRLVRWRQRQRFNKFTMSLPAPWINHRPIQRARREILISQSSCARWIIEIDFGGKSIIASSLWNILRAVVLQNNFPNNMQGTASRLIPCPDSSNLYVCCALWRPINGLWKLIKMFAI